MNISEKVSKTISEVALEFDVSEATVRNWIKTNLLSLSENKEITQDSVNYLKENVVGKKKLLSRANKQQKDSHNHILLSSEIQQKIESENGSEKIGSEYENSLSNSYKNKEGIYYTPDFIVRDMMKDFSGNLSNKTFLDPCCGSGNFIVEAIRLGFAPENVFGFDVDKNAVEITKKRIFEQTGYLSENIVVADFLEQSVTKKKHFDYIFTNPPWGKKISKTDKQKYSKTFEAGKSVDTAALFFFACLSIVKTNGKLGFLLPDSFFNIGAFEDVRKKALEYQIDRLIDYKNPFKGLLSKAQAIIITNYKSNKKHLTQCEFNNEINFRSQNSFSENPKLILNFRTSQNEAELIRHAYNLPHITLKNKAVFGLGIVTGNNKTICKTKAKKGLIPMYKGSDISKKGLKNPSCFIEKDFKNFQQTAPEHLYNAPEKLIYKFISNQLCFFYDTQQRYILNSANLLILNDDFPINGKKVTELLNSDFMTWLFRKMFATHKVLKSDLQHLPIHFKYYEKNSNFTESKFLDYLGIQKSDETYVFKR